MFDGQDILDGFKGLESQIANIPDDHFKFTFIDRLSKHVKTEMGWSWKQATNFAISMNYNVTEEAIQLPEYDEIEQCFFRLLVNVMRLYQKRFPHASIAGIISAAAGMEFELKI